MFLSFLSYTSLFITALFSGKGHADPKADFSSNMDSVASHSQSRQLLANPTYDCFDLPRTMPKVELQVGSKDESQSDGAFLIDLNPPYYFTSLHGNITHLEVVRNQGDPLPVEMEHLKDVNKLKVFPLQSIEGYHTLLVVAYNRCGAALQVLSVEVGDFEPSHLALIEKKEKSQKQCAFYYIGSYVFYALAPILGLLLGWSCFRYAPAQVERRERAEKILEMQQRATTRY